MSIKKKILSLFAVFLLFSILGYGQVREKGEISGFVLDEEGIGLPGVSVVLTGKSLFQKSLSSVTNERGFFRFLNLNPGEYAVEISLTGFTTTKLPNVLVGVGRSTPIQVKITPEKLAKEIKVVAESPLIETKTPQISHNFDNFIIQNAPNSRNFIDVINAMPAVNDNDAYGESGNVSWGGGGVYLARGSMTSSFRLNGVDVSNPAYGMTYVNPIYETIEEIQVVSIGASAEYGNFVGAAVNIVTKSGTNELHGSLSSNYTDNKFYAKNVTKNSYYDYQIDWAYNAEVAATLSGPIIKEKLFFSLAGGYAGLKTKYKTSENWEMQNRPRGYAKFDYLLDNKNTLSLLLNINPSTHKNYGLWGPLYAKSTAFDEKLMMNAVEASWSSIISPKSFLYVKFAGYKDEIKWDPQHPGISNYSDYSIDASYGSAQMERRIYSSRWSINTQLSYFADQLLGMTHEIKLGLEYDRAQAGEWTKQSGGGYFYSLPINGITLWQAYTGGNLDNLGIISTPRAYIQDDIKVNKKLYMNLGLRYERPVVTARKFTGDVAKFNILSPRLGFSYDIGGDGKTVIRGSFGMFYNQPLIGTYYYCLPGNDDQYEYTMYLPTSQPFNPTDENIKARFAELTQPQNLTNVYKYGTPVPVDPNLKLNRSDVFSLGIQRQVGNNFAVELNYIYKRGTNRYQINSANVHTYEPYQWTDPWLGQTITLYNQTDNLPDYPLVFTNSSWAKTRHHFIEVILRKNPTKSWGMMFSYVYQNSKSNLPGLGSNDVFGFPDYNMDTDPQYYKDPNMWGKQWMHEHQFKLITTYFGPWGITISGDARVMSGQPWAPEISTGYIPTAYRPYRSIGGTSTIFIEPRGSHKAPMAAILNLRVGKIFKISGTELEVQFDTFNALNAKYYYRTITRPWALFPNGESAYGQPSSLFPPRSSRVSFVWRF